MNVIAAWCPPDLIHPRWCCHVELHGAICGDRHRERRPAVNVGQAAQVNTVATVLPPSLVRAVSGQDVQAVNELTILGGVICEDAFHSTEPGHDLAANL